MKKLILLFLLFVSLNCWAQEDKRTTDSDYANSEVEMADVMRQNGKIYVVVGVILIIFAGITFYLFKLDKKISALEKEIMENNTSN